MAVSCSDNNLLGTAQTQRCVALNIYARIDVICSHLRWNSAKCTHAATPAIGAQGS